MDAVSLRTTRRSFLAAMGGTLAGVPALHAVASPGLALETYCFHDVDLATTLARTRELGLRVLELHDGHLPRDSTPETVARARAALQQSGIDPAGIYIHDAFTDSEAVARPIFEFARQVGVRYINGGPKREALPLLDRLVGELGIRIALHNHGPGARYETIEDVTSALDRYPRLWACIDIGHFARAHVDPARAIRAIGRRAIAVHLKDVDRAGENAIVGKGTIDLPAVFAALDDSGFDGVWVLEYEGDLEDMQKRLAGMRESLIYIERFFANSRRR